MSEEFNIETARAMMERDRKARLEKANQELGEIMKKYGVSLIATPLITTDGRVIATVQLQFQE